MRFILKGPFKKNIYSSMREIGYHFLSKDNKNSEMSFARFLERSGYPRFHIYLKIEKENLVFNLHLDQKRPIYQGVPAHSAEYGGRVVEKEVERIKENLRTSLRENLVSLR